LIPQKTLKSLGNIGDPRAIEPLKNTVQKDKDSDVKRLAQEVLKKIEQKQKGE